MIDPKLILESPQVVTDSLKRRRESIDLAPLVELGRGRKLVLQQMEQMRHEAKLLSDKIGQHIKASAGKSTKEIEALKKKTQQLKGYIKTSEDEIAAIDLKMQPIWLRLPNLIDDSVPDGKSPEDNQEIRRHLSPKSSNNEGLDHLEIGHRLGILDFERAAKISGSRFALLCGDAAIMELGLIRFMMDVHVQEHGYLPVIPPYLINPTALMGTGQLPKFHEEVFFLEKDNLYLAPTAEVPVTNIHAGEILDPAVLPIRYVAFSPCFRREAGSYGKDIKGLIRQHQFHKVEMVKITTAESSYSELESMTANAEAILQKLGLPYRILALCSADVGFSAAKTYDLEVWMQGQGTYREISSCSNCTDFQARRMNLRYKPEKNSKTQFAHTLNGSGLAVGRTLIALLEYYWHPDGYVLIPEVLRPYCYGKDRITAREK